MPPTVPVGPFNGLSLIDSTASAEKVNILLVDDQPGKLLAHESVLAELGQNIVKASSGREALRCLLKDDFAVILLDVNMPEMDGFETAALIRERKRSEHTPIIFVTAFNDEVQIDACLAIEDDRVLHQEAAGIGTRKSCEQIEQETGGTMRAVERYDVLFFDVRAE